MSGHGQVAAIVAEAGTGKSRLAYEFKATLPTPTRCKLLEAYSVSYGKASAWLPVLELLNTYFEIASVDDSPTRRRKMSSKLG
jgi:hypothetical protein